MTNGGSRQSCTAVARTRVIARATWPTGSTRRSADLGVVTRHTQVLACAVVQVTPRRRLERVPTRTVTGSRWTVPEVLWMPLTSCVLRGDSRGRIFGCEQTQWVTLRRESRHGNVAMRFAAAAREASRRQLLEMCFFAYSARSSTCGGGESPEHRATELLIMRAAPAGTPEMTRARSHGEKVLEKHAIVDSYSPRVRAANASRLRFTAQSRAMRSIAATRSETNAQAWEQTATTDGRVRVVGVPFASHKSKGRDGSNLISSIPLQTAGSAPTRRRFASGMP